MDANTTGFHVSEKAFFDQLVAERGDFNVFTPRGWSRLRKEFETVTETQDRFRVLDIGCGTGSSRQIYTGRLSDYVGIDLSAEAIDFARSRYPEATWTEGSAEELPFPDCSFDVIAFSSVLHHLPSMQIALAEAKRVLKPNGVCFAFDPHLFNPAMLLLRYPRSPFYIREGVSPNECPLTAFAIRRAFSGVGFKAVHVKATSVEFQSVKPKLVNILLPTFRIVDRIFEITAVNRIIGTFLISVGHKND